MKTQTLAFDVYDTLACWPDSRVKPIEVQRLLSRFGVEISYQAFEAARQSVLFFDCAKRWIGGWTDFLALVFHAMGARVSIDLLTGITAMYESRNNMTFFSDALPAVDAARAAGLRTCAFTTLPAFMLGQQGHELLSRLDHYFDASLTGYPKGHRRFYESIAQRLGVMPEEILAVGDDPICDCELPMDAGWQAILLHRNDATRTDAASSFRTIRSLSELPPIFRAEATAGRPSPWPPGQ